MKPNPSHKQRKISKLYHQLDILKLQLYISQRYRDLGIYCGESKIRSCLDKYLLEGKEKEFQNLRQLSNEKY